jgi:hypothetical protein
MMALVAVLVLGLAGGAWADNVSGLGAHEGADGVVFKSFSASTNSFLAKYLCKDASATTTIASIAVADCCVGGDVWRGIISIGTGPKVAMATNVGSGVAGALALAPDVFSADASVAGRTTSAIFISGNTTPGGLPAGWTGRVTYNAGGPVCALKKVINGSASP